VLFHYGLHCTYVGEKWGVVPRWYLPIMAVWYLAFFKEAASQAS